MIANMIAILFFFILFFFSTKEGFEDDYMTLVIASLLSARKDSRMTPTQIIAIEDGLRYAQFIKNIKSI